MRDVVAEYVALVARAGRLLPGLAAVPPAARARAAAEPRPTASGLVRATGRLAIALADADLAEPRARFLDAQLRACECTARRLTGQAVPFPEEVARTFGVAVHCGEPDRYRHAHAELADLLPGRGPLAVRMAAHRQRDEVPPDLLLPATRALSDALRARTPWLPAGEDVTFAVVADAPWTALHTWRGAGRSVVTVSLAARLRWGQLPGLVAHETYPGHHTQRCRTDAAAPEQRVVLVRSPQSVVAEGAAEEGLGVVVGPGWGTWAEEVLDGLAPGGFDGGLAERIDDVASVLRPVRLDAALLHHDRHAAAGAAAEHLSRWLLVDGPRARRIVAASAAPLWRGHVAAHVVGPPLVNSWLRHGAGSVVDRYRRLLDEPLLPADLRATSTAGPDGSPPEGSRPATILGSTVATAR